MKKYEIHIKGVSDALQNKLDRAIIQEQSKIRKEELDNWEEENWRKKLYTAEIDGEEKVVWPDRNVLGMIQEACKKYTVRPPKGVGRTWTAYSKASLFVLEPSVIESGEIKPFGSMVNGNPSSGKKSSKVYKVRPLIPSGWTTTVHVVDALGKTDKDTIQGIFEVAGTLIGLSDWRPMYGRFVVEKVKEVTA